MLWGRIIGSFLGFLWAGPIGLLLGFFVGNSFDRGYYRQFSFNSAAQQDIQRVYFKTTFQVMGHVAKSDGRVSEQEIRTAKNIMQRMQLNSQQIKQAIAYFNEGKQANFNLIDALTALVQTCHSQRVLLQMFVEIQFQAAAVDGLGEPKKKVILETICQRLGFSPLFSRFESMYRGGGQQYQRSSSGFSTGHSLKDDYAMLDIAKTATDAEVKRAYRRAMSQNHPDKLIAKGLPEELIKVATDKSQRIQASYERICQSRGMR